MRPLYLWSLLALPLATTAAFCAEPALTIYNQDFAVVRDTVPLDLQGRGQRRALHRNHHPPGAGLRPPARSGGQGPPSRCSSKTTAPTPFRRRCCSRSSRARPSTSSCTSPKRRPGGGAGQDHPQRLRAAFRRAATLRQPYYQQQQASTPTATRARASRSSRSMASCASPCPASRSFPPWPTTPSSSRRSPGKSRARQPAKLDAELAYVTGGMTWQADYSVVAPEHGDQIDLHGPGDDGQPERQDLHRRQDQAHGRRREQDQPEQRLMTAAVRREIAMVSRRVARTGPGVTEKTFDEYHLYSLPRPTTLRDRETKQVEFVRAEGIASSVFYVYDGVKIDAALPQLLDGEHPQPVRLRHAVQPEGVGHARVQELGGQPPGHAAAQGPRALLPARRPDGQLEFTGENVIDHTPKDETVRVFTGAAFDLTGERKRTAFKVDNSRDCGGRMRSRSSCATTRRNPWKSAWSSTSTAGRTGRSARTAIPS